MSEKFEFNSTVILDGVRLIPGKINVSKNANGELVEHMGDPNVNGSDIYLIDTKMGSVMLTVDGLSTVKLREQDLEKNRHLATLTVVNSEVENVEIRGNNTVVFCNMKNCILRDSLVEFTEPKTTTDQREEVSGISFSNTEAIDTKFYSGDEDADEREEILLTVSSSTLKNSFIICYNGNITISSLKNTSLTTNASLTLARAVLNDCRLEATDLIFITKGQWEWLDFKTTQIDVHGQFYMCRIQTPDVDFYFYTANKDFYWVASHKGYYDIEVKLGDPVFEQKILDMVADGAVVTDWHRSIAKYVIDTLTSRLKVLKVIEEALEKADGVITHDGKS